MPEEGVRAVALAAALSGMLAAAHDLHPDDVPLLTAHAVALIGGSAVEIYIADLAQDVLLRFSGDGEDELDIDATMAGRAFRQVEPTVLDVDGGRRAWVPILDGADRIGVIGAVFDDDSNISMLETIASLTAEVLVARCQYGDSIALARRRQPLSLPAELRWSTLPPRTFATERVVISAVVEPAYEIAGDSFDYSAVGETVHLAVIDAMGHGLEASRIANLVVAAYRHARRSGLDLSAMHAVIDAAVNQEFGDFKYATGVLAQLDTSSGLLRLLLAGHPRPLLLRNGRLIGELAVVPTLPFGIGDVAPTVGEFALEPDDRVLLYSDGVVEARNAKGDLFGVDRLSDLLARATSSEEPHPETMRRLSKAILQHQGTPLQDDATLLLLHWRRADD